METRLKTYLIAGLRLLRESILRTRYSGWRSVWTCLSTRLLNLRRRIQNKLYRRFNVVCPCCGWRGYGFLYVDCGKFAVPDAACPHCPGQERHRMMHMFLTRRSPEFLGIETTGRVVHFAPEPPIRPFLEANPHLVTLATDYALSMVKYAPRPGFTADIQHLPLEDASVDGLFCLHVLEHIPDDHLAIRELYRVLKDDGQAVIMAPFMMNQIETIEYGAPDPHMFGHVRGYSPLDFKRRLSPFKYEEVFPGDFLTEEEIDTFKLPCDNQVIYLCRK